MIRKYTIIWETYAVIQQINQVTVLYNFPYIMLYKYHTCAHKSICGAVLHLHWWACAPVLDSGLNNFWASEVSLFICLHQWHTFKHCLSLCACKPGQHHSFLKFRKLVADTVLTFLGKEHAFNSSLKWNRRMQHFVWRKERENEQQYKAVICGDSIYCARCCAPICCRRDARLAARGHVPSLFINFPAETAPPKLGGLVPGAIMVTKLWKGRRAVVAGCEQRGKAVWTPPGRGRWWDI